MLQGGGRGDSVSDQLSLTIPSGQATHPGILDLGKNYAFMAIAIRDAAGIPTSAALSLQVGIETPAQLYIVCESNDPTQALYT